MSGTWVPKPCVTGSAPVAQAASRPASSVISLITMSGCQAVARGIRSSARRTEGRAKRWTASRPSCSSWLAAGTALARASSARASPMPGPTVQVVKPRRCRSGTMSAPVATHDLVPGVAGGVHQREHREDVPDERAGGEQNSHDRH